MGQTNIRQATELLSGAGRGRYGGAFDQVALLPEANCRVHIESRSCEQSELDRYASMLNLPQALQRRWIGADEVIWTGNVPGYALAKTTLTPGLVDFGKLPRRSGNDEAIKQPDGLVFIAIMEGRPGSALQKIHVAYSHLEIANAIYHAAINGYSTVFSGAFLKSTLTEASTLAQRDRVQWKKVESLDELIRVQDKSTGDGDWTVSSVGIIC